MTDQEDNLMLFTQDSDYANSDEIVPAWNILIADDDTAIHSVTKLVLSDVLFEGRPLNFLSTYSGKQTRDLLMQEHEIAIILLDVVMETPHSGLDVVHFLREEQHNHRTRVILRTGQPGEAPERAIITEYDINDYKEKADLTSQRLFSCVLSALRSYRDIITIEQGKRSLERIIESSNLIFRANNSLSRFAKAVLDQIAALLQSDSSFMYIRSDNFSAFSSDGNFEIINGTPAFSNFLHKPIHILSREKIEAMVEKVLREKHTHVSEYDYIAYFSSPHGFESVLYLGSKIEFSQLDRQILDLFSRNITQAFENLSFNKELMDTQKELLFTIGDIVESHQPFGSGHLCRVNEFCLSLARLLQLPEEELELLSNAVILHDMGMVVVPDSIISKTSPLEAEEAKTMRHHTEAGFTILSVSKRNSIQTAAVVASQHHERWDGQGYPNGLAGEQIHLYARICTIADAVDSMAHDRPYRPALSDDQIRQDLSENSGVKFDPRLTAMVLDNFPAFIRIVKADPE